MLKKRVLVFASYYLPGHNAGGPIRSLENIFNLLSEDIEFYLVTLNRDLGDKKPYKGVSINTWVKVGEVFVFYTDRNYLKRSIFNKIFERVQPDTVYLNSLFSFGFSMHVLWMISISRFNGVKLVLAPRGELSEGALEQKKIKKFCFILLSKHLKVYKNLVWHASSKYEYFDIKKKYGDYGKICIASNLVNSAKAKSYSVLDLNKNKGEIKIIFISRISKKKNLDFAIKSLTKLKGNISFEIYGPHEDQAYTDECKSLALNLPKNISVLFKGDVKHNKVSELFMKYDIFYFPTKGENFGQVIWESLSCGCPVLISDQTPWNDIETHHAGWVRSLSKMDDFSKVLQGIIDNNLEYCTDRHNIHRYALQVANTSNSIMANKEMFINNE